MSDPPQGSSTTPIGDAPTSAQDSAQRPVIHVHAAPESWLKKFRGDDPRDVSRFEYDVKACFDARPELTLPQRASFILRNLFISVREELECYPDILNDPEKVFAKIREVYGEPRSALELERSFHIIEQSPLEDVRGYSQRLHKGFRELHEQQKRESLQLTEDRKLRQLFLTGLQNDSLKLHLRQHLLSKPEAFRFMNNKTWPCCVEPPQIWWKIYFSSISLKYLFH